MSDYVQRVALRAASYDPARVALTILAAPFYLVGVIVAVLWLSVTWIYAAGATGFGDAVRRQGPES